MDARVTARFFQVSAQEGALDFHEILEAAVKGNKPGDREKSLENDLIVRLEHCETDGEYLIGEFCRKQVSNFPPEVEKEGLTAFQLTKGEGLGHRAAFRYHRTLRVLLLQHNILAVSPIRLSLYVSALSDGSLFTFSPVLRHDAWERFKNKEVKGFEVTFASPEDLGAIDDKDVPAITGARMLAKAYNGTAVTIKVSVGRHKKKSLLHKPVTDAVKRFLGADVDVSNVKIDLGSKEHDRYVDFIEEHLKESHVLTLDADVSKNYAIRKAYLKKAFDTYLPYLKKHFGKKAANGDNG